MPKIGFKKGLIASLICVIAAYVVWPLTYDYFGEGAETTKNTVRQSKDVRSECQQVNRFLIVPWGLSIDDGERSGQLKITYWFICSGSVAKVQARYHHAGNGWITDSITAHLATGRLDLAVSKSGAAP